MKDSFLSALSVFAKPLVAIGGAVVLGVLIIGYAYYSTAVTPAGVLATVESGPITEEVDVSGTVKAAHATDLAFQVPGQVSAIRVSVGEHVYAGETLVTLAGGSQSAALAGAEATLEVQKAKLAALQSGTRPEQLAIDETNLAQAESALGDALQGAYVAADDALHAKADQLFSNPRTSDAKLTITVPDATLVQTVEHERVYLEPLLLNWEAALQQTSDSLSVASTSVTTLDQLGTFLDNLAKALAETPVGGSLSASTLAGYQANINAARAAVSSARTGVTSATTGYKSASGALALAQAGATPQDIAAQQAAVDVAEAAVLSARVSLGQTALVAPIAGTITAQNANPGQTVSPGVPLVSMVADGKYQATARLSDTDVAKVKVGQSVEATFAAYPGATFEAKVTTVDPTASVVGGTSSYGVTVTFNTNDPRLASGMAANLRIITNTKQSVLMIPTSALITDGTTAFVYVSQHGQTTRTPVVVGIKSADGMSEIISGLSVGQQVLTYGASAAQ